MKDKIIGFCKKFHRKLNREEIIAVYRAFNMFSEDLATLLIEFCLSNNFDIDRISKQWKTKGIFTVEQAQDHLSLYQDKYRDILSLLNITRECVTYKEKRIIDSWNYSQQEIKKAAEIALSYCGEQSSVNYMDNVLKSKRKGGISFNFDESIRSIHDETLEEIDMMILNHTWNK